MATKTQARTIESKASSYPTEGLARIPQAAEFLAVGKDTVYKMIREGQLRSVQVREAVRVPWPVLHQFASSAK